MAIELKLNFDGPTHRYSTLAGARRAMRRLLGRRVRIDPDGYLVGGNGNCLFVSGVSLEEMISLEESDG